ncbi:dihydropteroate synthase [Desulfuromonas sp. AOP6]|uniref:dihydropteroate synthase n=1 Tax=Desulfuromonas sp. AOP6 TaxID=1566351 RepID=UPI0012824415|nr:dihydropteroate synthase [Desulfuromonas sp. AOP6]BCA80415.1 dihydropteroate synthase [Desulfuromonas sp. AOP6]
MPFALRLLQIADEVAARLEIQRIGADPAGVEKMAGKMVPALVKISALPCRCANILKQEMLAVGGDAAVARGSVACSIEHTDTILIGTRKQLGLLSRRLGAQPFGLAALGQEIAAFLRDVESAPSQLYGQHGCLDLSRPAVMAILNITPDSFSDGGRYQNLDDALRRVEALVSEGADLIDVGGESTRPGAEAVESRQEVGRVVPVIEAIRKRFDVLLSVDTTKSEVAAASLDAGVHFINDISGMQFDSRMAATVASRGAGVFIMHTRGRPDTMQQETRYQDLLGEIIAYLRQCLDQGRAAGIPDSHMAVDPGVGFAKDLDGNLEIIRRLGELRSLGRPILLGTSRKGFIGKILDEPNPEERVIGTMATVALGVQQGASLFRVHDVKAARQAADMAWAICKPRGDVINK